MLALFCQEKNSEINFSKKNFTQNHQQLNMSLITRNFHATEASRFKIFKLPFMIHAPFLKLNS